MLRILYGKDWQYNAYAVMDSLCENAKQGVDRQILIVPEQFSFDAEWRLSECGGDRIALYAEVLSFTRLYDRVCAQTGGAAVRIMDQSGRLIAMAGALEQVRSQLKIYGVHIAKPEFLLQLLALYEELKSYGVDSDGLRTAQQRLGGLLAEKLEELRLIFESYESVCTHAAQDPATRLSRLADKLYESELACGRAVFLDGFSDFTTQELDVIEALLKTQAEVTVSLCCDDLRTGQEGFSVTRDTAQKLRERALRCKAEVSVQRLIPQAQTPAGAHLRDHLFDGQTPAFDGQAPLELQQADSPYDEARSAVAGIWQLVRDGARWRDIAVACTEPNQFVPALERLFTRYCIPGYFSGTKELLQTQVVRAVLSALRAASGRMDVQDVLDYLKSGLAPIDREVCDRLENYALVWDLRGSLWEKPFDRDPAGFAAGNDPASYAEALAMLNEARELAVQPLVRLRQDLRQAENTGAQILALHTFMESIGLAERLSEITEHLQADGELQRAQQTGQIYDILLDTMEQIYGVLGKSVRSPEEFYQFFRAALSRHSVGTIPATLDCVRVGSLRDLRNNRAPYLFVLGASDGLLPARAAEKGLLTPTERRRLMDAGLTVGPDAHEQLSRELLCAYTVLTSPKKGLYLRCRTDEPSYLYTRLAALFPDRETLPSQPLPVTKAQAAAQLARYTELPPQTDPQLQAAALALRDKAAYGVGELSPKTVQGLYGQTLYLSASRVDQFASCRFAFFLNYGLKAVQHKKAQIDAPLFGTFVHYVLEHTVKQVMAESDFHHIAPERLTELANQAIETFVETELSGFSEQPERAKYLFRRRWEEVLAVVRDIWEELRQSDFTPVGVELPFRNQTAVRIQGKTAAAEMNGFVDRVDRYDAADGSSYIRVVDYKTGSKDFDYTDILSGIGLQMLIYLFALEQRGTELFGAQVEGAGVLYVPTRVDVLSNVAKLSPEQAEKQRREAFRRKGLVLSDETVRLAMEPSEQPVYLPCTKDRSGRLSHLADETQMEQLKRFVFRLLGDLTDEIASGAIAPNPYRRGDRSPCDYCKFGTVCHVSGGAVAVRSLAETGEQQFWQQIERRDAEHG